MVKTAKMVLNVHPSMHTHFSLPSETIQQMASAKLKEALKNDGFKYKMRQERVKQMLKGCLFLPA